MTRDWDAIVVGSGIGGLGAAALLARAGSRVLVLERHSVAGGLTHTFHRKGFEWDVGLHYLGKVHDPDDPLRRVFDHVTDGALQWAPMGPVYDRVIVDGEPHDFAPGRAALEDTLGRRFPRERHAIGQYLDRIAQVASRSQAYFLERALPGPLAWLLGPFLGASFRRDAGRTTGSVLGSLTSDPRLRAVLAGRWGNYGLPPAESSFAMHALVAEFYLDGGSYPVGGASGIAASILPVIERAGGAVRLSTPVEEIVIRGGRAVGVRLVDGDVITAPIVISNAGVHNTLSRLLPEPLRPKREIAKLDQLRLSGGHTALYLGLDRDAHPLGLSSTNLWIHPSDDLDGNHRRHLADPSTPPPFVYVSSPSAKDPDWPRRHPGKSTVVAICPAAFDTFQPWKDTRWRRRGADYEACKARIADEMYAVVERELPGIAGHVVYRELSTPLTTAHFSGHPDGAIYGIEHAPARFRQAWLRPASPIPGLFWVGQDLTTVGVGSSLMSAVLAASVILRRNVLGELVRERPQTAIATRHRRAS